MLAASTPRTSRIGSTIGSKGVVREPQQSRGPTQSEVSDSFSCLLPARAAAAFCTLASVESSLRFTLEDRALSMGEAATMPAPTRERTEIMEKRIVMLKRQLVVTKNGIEIEVRSCLNDEIGIESSVI